MTKEQEQENAIEDLIKTVQKLQAENSRMREAIINALLLYSPTAFPATYKALQDSIKGGRP
jgi:hypothetical protein